MAARKPLVIVNGQVQQIQAGDLVDSATLDATLAALAGLATGANKIPMATGTDTFTQIDFKDEDDMASDSATAVPSQQSVKAYVDAAVGGATGTDTQTLTNANAGTINIGQPVYASAAGSVDLARANAVGTSRVVGLVADTTIATTASGAIQTDGVVTATTGQWDAVTGGTGGLTFNTEYYLDPATAGMLTTTAPTTDGQVVAPIGVALSATKMRLNIKGTVLL